ncbi:MAG: hypothetical protein NXI16_08990 [Alphaproteobacteria bacterium]|nr:hypothetical protein [Alphaproteobacteria bacterium]
MAMMKVEATIMDAGVGEGHGADHRYVFDAPDDLFTKSPITVIKAFMEHVDHVELPDEHVGYELYASLKNEEKQVVTGMGSLTLAHGRIPFMVMISPKAD